MIQVMMSPKIVKMPCDGRALYDQLKIEENYPEHCPGWWDFWKFYGCHINNDNTDEIMESWQNWVDQDDPYPCQDEWEYI